MFLQQLSEDQACVDEVICLSSELLDSGLAQGSPRRLAPLLRSSLLLRLVDEQLTRTLRSAWDVLRRGPPLHRKARRARHHGSAAKGRRSRSAVPQHEESAEHVTDRAPVCYLGDCGQISVDPSNEQEHTGGFASPEGCSDANAICLEMSDGMEPGPEPGNAAPRGVEPQADVVAVLSPQADQARSRGVSFARGAAGDADVDGGVDATGCRSPSLAGDRRHGRSPSLGSRSPIAVVSPQEVYAELLAETARAAVAECEERARLREQAMRRDFEELQAELRVLRSEAQLTMQHNGVQEANTESAAKASGQMGEDQTPQGMFPEVAQLQLDQACENGALAAAPPPPEEPEAAEAIVARLEEQECKAEEEPGPVSQDKKEEETAQGQGKAEKKEEPVPGKEEKQEEKEGKQEDKPEEMEEDAEEQEEIVREEETGALGLSSAAAEEDENRAERSPAPGADRSPAPPDFSAVVPTASQLRQQQPKEQQPKSAQQESRATGSQHKSRAAAVLGTKGRGDAPDQPLGTRVVADEEAPSCHNQSGQASSVAQASVVQKGNRPRARCRGPGCCRGGSGGDSGSEDETPAGKEGLAADEGGAAPENRPRPRCGDGSGHCALM